MRTRIKICGITTPDDGLAAANAGADAIGFICYPPSPRYVAPPVASQIAMRMPPFVARVAVFVNPSAKEVAAVLDSVRIDMLQFHGDENAAFCASFGLPYLKTARMRPDLDLLEYLAPFRGAAGWSRIPSALERPIVLSGGLEVANVREGIQRVRPWAVDVSSGVEVEENGTIVRGKKDHLKIERFIAEVRNAEK